MFLAGLVNNLLRIDTRGPLFVVDYNRLLEFLDLDEFTSAIRDVEDFDLDQFQKEMLLETPPNFHPLVSRYTDYVKQKQRTIRSDLRDLFNKLISTKGQIQEIPDPHLGLWLWVHNGNEPALSKELIFQVLDRVDRTGLEETYAQRVRKMVTQNVGQSITERRSSEMELGGAFKSVYRWGIVDYDETVKFSERGFKSALVKGTPGTWWIHLHLGNYGLLFRLVLSPENKIVNLTDSMAEPPVGNVRNPEKLEGFIPLKGLLDRGDVEWLEQKAREVVEKTRGDLEKGIHQDNPLFVLAKAVSPGSEGLFQMAMIGTGKSRYATPDQFDAEGFYTSRWGGQRYQRLDHTPTGLEEGGGGEEAQSTQKKRREGPVAVEELLRRSKDGTKKSKELRQKFPRREFQFFDGRQGTVTQIPKEGAFISWSNLDGERFVGGFRVVRDGETKFLRVFKPVFSRHSYREAVVSLHQPESPERSEQLGILTSENRKPIVRDGLVIELQEKKGRWKESEVPRGIVIRPVGENPIYIADNLSLSSQKAPAGLEEQQVMERLAGLEEAAQGVGVVVMETQVLRDRAGLMEFVHRVRGELARRLILVGLEEAEAKMLQEYNPFIRAIPRGDLTGLVTTLVGLKEADRVTHVGDDRTLADQLTRVLPASMTVIHISPATGLEEFLLDMGVPAAVLDQVNASGLEEQLARRRAA